MSWREPLWLLLILFPLLLWSWQFLRRHKASQPYADTALLPWVQAGASTWKNKRRPILWSVFWCLIAISLAGPRLPLFNQTNKEQGTPNKEIMLVIDVSRSMQTQDIQPSRIQRIRLELFEWLQMMQQSSQNNRIGVVIYAGRAHLLVPATHDMTALKFYLKQLDSLVLPTRGSDAAGALTKARRLLDDDINDTKDNDQTVSRMIVWLTDGDISSQQRPLINHAVDQLKQSNIGLYVLGVGTEDGESIPIAQGAWLKNTQGEMVRSKLDSRFLQQLTSRTKGRYSSVKEDQSDWQTLYQKGMARDFPAPINQDENQLWQELFVWALFPAILILFLLVSLPHELLALVIVLGLFGSSFTPNLSYAETLKKDQKIEPKNGVEAYRAGQYDDAIRLFTDEVFVNNEDDKARARALYNLGNSYFQQGDYLAAKQLFRDALRYRKDHPQTQQNLALATTAQTALELHLAKLKKEQAAREGVYAKVDGNRLEAIGNDLNWDQDSTKTSGKSINQAVTHLPNMQLNQERLKQLVSKGLKRLSQEGVDSTAEKIKRQQSLNEARIALQQMDDNPAVFWKRLFEIEEGFPGSLDKPKMIPKRQPW